MQSIVLQDFDTNIFEINYYRVINDDLTQIQSDLTQISKSNDYIIDAKIDAQNHELCKFLNESGFEKICEQTRFCAGSNHISSHSEINIVKNRSISDTDARKYANNFTFDRFSVDERLDQSKVKSMYATWIKNSFNSDKVMIAEYMKNFCSFRCHKNNLSIDLLCVTEKRKGIASKLLKAVINYAHDNCIDSINVTTETNNMPAVKTYLKNGFYSDRQLSCFHLVCKNGKVIGRAK